MMDFLDFPYGPVGFPDPTLGTAVLEITDFRWPFSFVRLDHSNLGSPFINHHVLLISKEMLGLYNIV